MRWWRGGNVFLVPMASWGRLRRYQEPKRWIECIRIPSTTLLNFRRACGVLMVRRGLHRCPFRLAVVQRYSAAHPVCDALRWRNLIELVGHKLPDAFPSDPDEESDATINVPVRCGPY